MEGFAELYQRYKVCMVRITTRTRKGNRVTDPGFHIGDGYIVTARHVIDDATIEGLDGEHSSDVRIDKIYYPHNPRIDLAVLHTDFDLEYYMTKVQYHPTDWIKEKVDCIQLGGHLDDWLGDELLMTDALLLGYPHIPFADRSELVAVRAEVNAVIDTYGEGGAGHPHFLLSAMPRRGFSGGPAISEYGFLLGVVTESLGENNKDLDLGFTYALSIEPLLNLLYDNDIRISNNPNILYQDEQVEVINELETDPGRADQEGIDQRGHSW